MLRKYIKLTCFLFLRHWQILLEVLSNFPWQLAQFGALSRRKRVIFEENPSKTLFLAIFSYLVGQTSLRRTFKDLFQLVIHETDGNQSFSHDFWLLEPHPGEKKGNFGGKFSKICVFQPFIPFLTPRTIC